MPDSTAVKQDDAGKNQPILEKGEYEQGMEDDDKEAIEEKIQIFGAGLQTEFDKQVGLKEEIEQRWLDDLRHYHGVYDKLTEIKLSKDEKASKIFVNLTRAKCNTAESKWSDLVLPTDDRNWGLKPTPVPTLVAALTDETSLKLVDGSQPVDPNTNEPLKTKDLAEAIMDEAVDAAKLMETEMDDQLTESRFNAVCRQVIHDAVVMGTGIIKGPMIERRVKKAWIMDEQGNWGMATNEEIKPTASSVDPWNFFPDMSAVNWKESEFTYERHLLTKKSLINLAKQPGFMPKQVAKVLLGEPNARQSKLSYLNELREISGITSIQQDNRYEVLEYHGPVDKSDMIACGCKGLDIDDPLDEYEGVVWLSMGTVIKIGLNHMDSEDLPYDILNWEKDDTGAFGFGVPYRMRSPQKVMNASWRMVLDNAGLSTGPQILINKSMIEPADGLWELSPRKIWWMNSKDPKFRVDHQMSTFEIDSHQEELTAVFEMAHRLADEETSVPQLGTGSQSPDSQQPAMLKTLGGTALWMSAQNIMMRRAVKNFDDDITVPFLTRLYDWNMQFSEKAEIKGDFNVDARGTSVLLVREMQARNIQEFINAALIMPDGAEELKTRGVLKNMAKGMQVAIGDVMRTDEEAKTAEEEAKTNPPVDPEAQKMEMQMEMKKMEIEAKMQLAEMEAREKMMALEGERQIALINREVELTKLAAVTESTLEKIRSDNAIKKYQVDWSIKAFYEEVKIKKEEGIEANYGLNEK